MVKRYAIRKVGEQQMLTRPPGADSEMLATGHLWFDYFMNRGQDTSWSFLSHEEPFDASWCPFKTWKSLRAARRALQRIEAGQDADCQPRQMIVLLDLKEGA